MDNPDDVPPLEDCSELLEKAKNLRSSGGAARAEAGAPSTSNSSSSSRPEASQASAEKPTTTAKKAPAKNQGFGGMKKGFLFGGPPKKVEKAPPKKDDDDLPMVKPTQTKEEALRIDEVQDSMKESLGFKKGWITEDLITKMVENDKLSKWLSDPRTSRVLEEFQADPAAAQEKYKNNADIIQFFRDFARLLGSHFTTLGNEQESRKKAEEEAAAAEGADIRPAVDAEVEKALEDPLVRAALMDPDVQRAIEAIKQNPSNGQRIMDSADSKLRYHLTTLVKAGILGVQ